MEDNMRELNMDEIGKVTGGTDNTGFDDKMKEFVTAWKRLNMDSKGISDSRKAAVYKEWELNDYQPCAYDFLKVL